MLTDVVISGIELLSMSRTINFSGVQALAFLGALSVALLSSCSTPSGGGAGQRPDVAYVRKVDFSAVPHTEALAERARQIGNQQYPKICALLADGDTWFPPQFDICLKPKLRAGISGEAQITRICLNGAYVSQFKNEPALFDQGLVHEMAHVAQHYYRPILGKWVIRDSHPPSCWEEGIADYVCFKLGESNGWRCAECGTAFPHYQNGYSCAGAFLLYLEATYNTNIVRQLNTVLRGAEYLRCLLLESDGQGPARAVG